jgi:hypothetical protein
VVIAAAIGIVKEPPPEGRRLIGREAVLERPDCNHEGEAFTLTGGDFSTVHRPRCPQAKWWQSSGFSLMRN